MSPDRKPEVDVSIEIEAEPERVWTAISSAEELRRWFPLDAEVEPGEGGSVTLSWGPGVEGTAPITVWRPGERLRWEEDWGGEGGEGVRVAVEFRIESVGGATRLRLVQSGFAEDDSWDEYLDTLDSGWRYFLYNLKHYLERHDGESRTMVWERRRVSGPKAVVWPRLLRLYGLDPERIEVGQTTRFWDGIEGRVVMARAPIHLALRVPELDDALLFLELEPGGDTFTLGTWLSLYGDSGVRAAELSDRLEATHDDALPAVEEAGSIEADG